MANDDLFRNVVAPHVPPGCGPIHAIECFFEIGKTHIEVVVPFNTPLDNIGQYKYMLYCTPSLPEACLLLTQLPIDSIPYACVDQTRPAHISNPLVFTPVQAPRGRNCVRSLQIYLSTPATGSVLHPFDRSRDFSLKCINSDFRVRNLLILFKFSCFFR